MFNLTHRLVTALLLLPIALLQPMATAQEIDAESALDDFIHYALIANVELSEGNAIALLRSQISDVDFYELVIATKIRHHRFDRAIGWAMFVEDLEPLAARLEERFELGRTSVIRNADRLQESIELLSGSVRQRTLATERLAEAGEYAVPSLLRTLHSTSDARTTRTVKEMLVRIGPDAVLPLSVAAPHLDDNGKILVANVLGEIGYMHSAPALIALMTNSNASPSVYFAASQALSRIGVDENADLSFFQTYVSRQFFDGKESVLPEAIGETNIFWTWDPMSQLVALDVPAVIYDDVMAMQFASDALNSNPDNKDAMSIFVAANLRRARDLAGQVDRVFGNMRYSPAFYATVFGPEIAQLVLAKALDDKDTLLALEAIDALSRTASSDSLLGGNGKPLIAAMNYPDRKVQYESAMVLASTIPSEEFTGSYRVVPLLASAVRNAGDIFAIVVGDNDNRRTEATSFLESNGWNVIGVGDTAHAAISAVGVVPGIDMAVVIARSAEHAQAVASQLSQLPKTTVTPVYILADGADAQILSDVLSGNDMIGTAHISKSDSAKLGDIEDLMYSASGGRLSHSEEIDFSNRALAVLRDIALADTVLQIDDATGTLIDALAVADSGSQSVIAQTLAMIDDELAQRALIDAALATDRDLEERVMLLDESAGSVRRWGNLAQGWQVNAIVDLAENANGFLSDAAARLNGALDHPNTSVMMFLP